MSKTKFIIATSSSEGGWCTDRGSTLSLINSHVASHKARQGVNRLWQQQAHHASVNNRPKKIASACLNHHTHTSNCDRQVSAKQSRSAEAPCTWSFEELNNIIKYEGVEKKQKDQHLALSAPIRHSNDGHEKPRDIESATAQGYDIINSCRRSSFETVPNFTSEYSMRGLFVAESRCVDSFVRCTGLDHTIGVRLPVQVSQEENAQHGCYNLQQIYTGLDPFLRLAVDVSNYERSLLHFCEYIAKHYLSGKSYH